MTTLKKTLFPMLLIIALLAYPGAVFAQDTSPAYTGEDISMADELTQEWYDEMYLSAQNYVIEPGTVVGNALRVKGQETLGEIEVSVMRAMEDSSLEDSDMISTDGRINIILLGIDARPGQKTGRSDCMILCSVDVNTAEIRMISFMRDMYVNIPGRNANRLNTPFFFGGADLLNETLKQNFGIGFDHYIAVNFSVLADLIDQLGGLDILIEDNYFKDRVNAVLKMDNKELGIPIETDLLKETGLLHLDGRQSQAYARFRFGAKSGGDFGRTGRQREVIMKIFDKVTKLSVAQMIQLAMNNIDKVSTDLTLPNLIELAPAALRLKGASFLEMRVPDDGQFISQTVNGMAVLVPKSTAINNAIRDFLTN
ncbi:MAG: LCP family protein [Clostridia bacterium]|nr:LCP family protein [Clostridia bacterium]